MSVSWHVLCWQRRGHISHIHSTATPALAVLGENYGYSGGSTSISIIGPYSDVVTVFHQGIVLHISLNFFIGRRRESSGRPLLLVPGKLLVRISLSSCDTLLDGYDVARPSKQLTVSLSPVEKNLCCNAFSAVSLFSGSYSSRPASKL